MELSCGALYAIPNLASRRRGTLGADEIVDAGFELAERVLDVAALSEASAQEGGVDGKQDPRPALEEDSSKEQANPQQNLEA